MIAGSAPSRRCLASTPRKFGTISPRPNSLGQGLHRPPCPSRLTTGLRDQPARSSLSPIACCSEARSRLDLLQGIPLGGELEQSGGVAAGHPDAVVLAGTLRFPDLLRERGRY